MSSLVLVLAYLVGALAQTQKIDFYKLDMLWHPSYCLENPCLNNPFEAFIITDLSSWQYDANGKNIRISCTAPADADITPYIPSGTKNHLRCSFKSSGDATDEQIWNDNWANPGSCSNLPVSDYFTLMTTLYNRHNPNVVMADNNIRPPTVDRDTFLATLSATYGKRAWIECDPKKKVLKEVQVCVSSKPPYDPVDCPWVPTQPDGNGVPCQGELSMPASRSGSTVSPPSIPTTPDCQPYVKGFPPADAPPPAAAPSPPPSPSPLPTPERAPPTPAVNPYGPSPVPVPPSPEPSSSNMGAIIGGVVGGIALIAALAAGIIFYKKKKKADNDFASAPGSNGYTYAPGAGGPAVDPRFATSPPTDSYYGARGLNGSSMGGIPENGALYAGAGLAAGAAVGAAGAAAAYNSNMSGSMPSTPATPFDGSEGFNSRRYSNALATDPLMQYINSTMSGSSGTSRGPLAAWQLRFEDINIEKPIGEGSWGRVYKGNWNQTQVAVKILLDGGNEHATSGTQSALMNSNSPIMQRLEQEASLMTQLHHPCIVQFLGITIFPAALVTEYCQRGSLTAVLQGGNKYPEQAAELTWSRRISMAADCCRGMLYLHTRTPAILHRDLKSANLLVTQTWKCKVSDFNLSKIMQDTTRSTSLAAMNPRWLAPEVLNGSAATTASDVFAFGVILWELLTWELPWGTSNPWGIVGQITNGNRLPIPPANQLPGPNSGGWNKLDQYLALMQRCWAQEPGDRPTFQEVMMELQQIDPAAVEN